jgi:hypothetical protein
MWLKATLLCVPAVARMVPDTYEPEDDAEFGPYCQLVGPSGPLLQQIPTFSNAAMRAQGRLLDRIRADEDEIVRRYRRGEHETLDEHWIHEAKFSHELLAYLRARGLAWPSANPRGHGRRTWYAMHPRLGSAVMTTLGISIAQERNWDLVTPNNAAHEMLLAAKLEDVFDALLRNPQAAAQPLDQQRELTEMVIVFAGINLASVPPEAIPELQASPLFEPFTNVMRKEARLAHAGVSKDRVRDLQESAAHLVDRWRAPRRGIFGRLLEAATDGAVETAVARCFNAVDVTMLALGPGVGIGLAALRGACEWFRRPSDGISFLTEIDQAQNQALMIRFPLGLAQS